MFLSQEYNFEILSSRLRELAFLNPGVRIKIKDLRDKKLLSNDSKGSQNRSCGNKNKLNKSIYFLILLN